MRALVLLVCTSLISSPSLARNSKRVRVVDPSYSSALSAANRFLQAWQTQNHETGIMMLSDAARQHTSPGLLDDFFSHAEAAYEIGPGRKLREGAYAFPVALFGAAPSRPRRSTLVVSRSGKDDWTVDRLP